MKKIAILQSNYIPWKGYFDLIRSVDEFILYDDVQFTKNDWRNRNQVKSSQGPQWLTIPCLTKGKAEQKIKDTLVSDHAWCVDHWKSIQNYYGKSAHLKDYKAQFEAVYAECASIQLLSQVNYKFITLVCGILGIKTKISWSTDYTLREGKTERLVGLCQDTGASYYLSGPAAKDYIEDRLFKEAGIELAYADYSNYPEYPQLYGKFEHRLSVLDLLFNAGPDALKYMKLL
jgi:hypothetical protein